MDTRNDIFFKLTKFTIKKEQHVYVNILSDGTWNNVQVCKYLCITTLIGFKKSNDTVVMKILTKAQDKVPLLADRRGKGRKRYWLIQTKSYFKVRLGPPQARTCSSEGKKLCPEIYQWGLRYSNYFYYNKVFKSMNISLTVLGNEEHEGSNTVK